MSCEFCKKFDFTSVAIKENNIHTAGGSGRFTDTAYDGRGFQLFQFCPLCGSSLLYERPSNNAIPAHSNTPVRVAIDMYGNRVDYAVFDDETTMSKEAYYTISQLKADTGCGFQMCKDAYNYATERDGGYGMMVAYCKAKIYAVKTNVPFDARIERFMEDMK